MISFFQVALVHVQMLNQVLKSPFQFNYGLLYDAVVAHNLYVQLTNDDSLPGLVSAEFSALRQLVWQFVQSAEPVAS